MENKIVGMVNAILWGMGMLLLLAAAFDVLPIEDNKLIFLALASFVISFVLKKIARVSCCK